MQVSTLMQVQHCPTGAAAVEQLDRMVAECMEDHDDLNADSDDENDPALMASLLLLLLSSGSSFLLKLPLV